MSFVFAILLAAASFAAIAFVFRLPRNAWTLVLTALVLGLAGYASQASPDLAGAPGHPPKDDTEVDWAVIDMRKGLVPPNLHSTAPLLVTADALARRGQYADAGVLLRGIVHENPNDSEAWLALGNALTFQADGVMTRAALLAYRRSEALAPNSGAPAFFVGWAMIRQGKLLEGRQVWADKLKQMPADAPGRDELAKRLANFDQILMKLVQQGNAKPQ
ncbi:MAG: cytochrome C biosynthesis protein [Candidatus Andeanibacterium colombiense]|uniref:Cytochrome C biosynthesis protein n=1 Tax=Candidatus Andeanibacterium colombiense TaxID=3121345 RepID=A0AAJ5X8V2_9SPHN|nr:MAG: cytochrome C biosynthesis protein [Sphingomonadaceae bacterium]